MSQRHVAFGNSKSRSPSLLSGALQFSRAGKTFRMSPPADAAAAFDLTGQAKAVKQRLL
jgi:hypothetical protein